MGVDSHWALLNNAPAARKVASGFVQYGRVVRMHRQDMTNRWCAIPKGHFTDPRAGQEGRRGRWTLAALLLITRGKVRTEGHTHDQNHDEEEDESHVYFFFWKNKMAHLSRSRKSRKISHRVHRLKKSIEKKSMKKSVKKSAKKHHSRKSISTKSSRKSCYTKVIKTKERRVKIGGKSFIVGGMMIRKSCRK